MTGLDHAIRFRRQVIHLHSLGVRALAEILVEIATNANCESIILELLAEYEEITSDQVERAGGDRFARIPLLLVPR